MKKLSLKAEHLTELTSHELSLAVGGAYTGLPTYCVITIHPGGCQSELCTGLDCLPDTIG